MRRELFFLILFIASVAIVFNTKILRTQNDPYASFDVVSIPIEIADDPAERTQGLSGRDSLPENSGMLFVFDEPGAHAIWMKEMKFSIDILWLDEGKVVWIVENAALPSEQGIPTFQPETTATHVLEVPAGFVQTYSISIGDPVTLHF